jgi:uncharacterized Zn-finger protein
MSESAPVANESKKVVEITTEALPLHCPGDQAPLWAMHPRVYLPLDENNSARCPYCGTQYRLKD